MRGAVTVRRFELVTHLAIAQQRQPLFRHRWPCDVTAQSFQFLAFVRPRRDTCVQRESSHLAHCGIERLIATRQRLQREHLAARVLPHRDAVGDRMAQELIQRSAFHGIARQIAVLGIAFQQALALQATSDAMRDGVCQLSQLGTRRRLHPAKLDARPIRAIDVDTVQKEHMEVDICIQRTAESLNQRHRAGAGRGAGKSRLDVHGRTNAAGGRMPEAALIKCVAMQR